MKPPIEKYYRTFRSFWGLKQGGDSPPEKATAKEGGGRLMDRNLQDQIAHATIKTNYGTIDLVIWSTL